MSIILFIILAGIPFYALLRPTKPVQPAPYTSEQGVEVLPFSSGAKTNA